MKHLALIALLATTACAPTTTIWENEHEQYGSQDAGGFDSGPVAGHTDPSGVVGVDNPANGDGPADSESGADNSGDSDVGDVGKGHDDHGDDHGKGHGHGDDDSDDGDDD
jgi:hypothetical protein